MKAQSDNPAVILGFLMLGSVGAAFLLFTMMGGGFFVALLVLALLPLALLVVALEVVFGYQPIAEIGVVPAPTSAPALGRPIVWGVVATLVLLGLYGGVMIAVQGVAHTIADSGRHGILLALVPAGFGLLIGLARQYAPRHDLSLGGTILAGIGTGVGIVALMSCCILPLVFRVPGAAGTATTLYLNHGPITMVGVLVNLLGLAWIAMDTRLVPPKASGNDVWRANPWVGGI